MYVEFVFLIQALNCEIKFGENYWNWLHRQNFFAKFNFSFDISVYLAVAVEQLYNKD